MKSERYIPLEVAHTISFKAKSKIHHYVVSVPTRLLLTKS